ncbi:hypothetical protein KSP35_06235 [Aquihabitans sp. G128]|uniref:RcpC/CpaB family pilus assembly protein n=1 Tax=Aquihabitans sp. G128 TaxID=2849779 RepID=UPI001C2127F4|nr:RcpC/CpaB family pilus assembly protein [Aquihabitans sp. G128]QXC62395.1 hypothetical protein KSP35_06235 [Aquihabitans sp. G128]
MRPSLPHRTIRPRVGLPGSRSVVGGLLVALAALGTWWVATGAGADPVPRYVVATRLIGPGERLTAQDLGWSSVGLPARLRAQAFDDPGDLVGTVALGPIDEGELVQSGAIEAVGPGTVRRELSFAVESDWAVDGTLRPGDRIDVFTTSGEGEGATSERVLAGATVQAISSSGGDGLGEQRGQTITVAVADPDVVAATVTGSRADTVTVVRVTGVHRGGR